MKNQPDRQSGMTRSIMAKMVVLVLITVSIVASIVPWAVHLALNGTVADNWIPRMELFIMTVGMLGFGLLAREIEAISFRKAIMLIFIRTLVSSALMFPLAWIIARDY
jgi:hypothetical protein